MKNRPIAVVYSDIHYHIWNDFWEQNGITRLQWTMKAHEVIIKKAKKLGVPTFFAGDMMHNPKAIRNSLMETMLPFFQELYEGHTEYAISGNHDQERANYYNNESPSYIKTLDKIIPGFHCIDFKNQFIDEVGDMDSQIRLFGVPYITHNKGFVDYVNDIPRDGGDLNILMIHADLPNAVTTAGYKFTDVMNMNVKLTELFQDFSLVIGGHIHKPQELGAQIFLAGSPIHQSRGDIGTKMGYWIIYLDGTKKFIHLKGFPQFKTYKEGEPTDLLNYWTKVVERKTKEGKEVEMAEIDVKTKKGRKQLIKSYIKETGIKNKRHKMALRKYLLQ